MSLVKSWDIECMSSLSSRRFSLVASFRGEEAISKGLGVDAVDRREDAGSEKRDAGLDRVAARSASSIDLFLEPKTRHNCFRIV